MTPESWDYLAKAEDDLADARKILAIGLSKVAARCAYYAGFHAAEALLMERTGKVAKTHSGVRSGLARVIGGGSAADRELLTFLAQAYKYKELSDYAVGETAVVTHSDAIELIEAADRFLARVSVLLGATGED